jgi:hypothetical protein
MYAGRVILLLLWLAHALVCYHVTGGEIYTLKGECLQTFLLYNLVYTSMASWILWPGFVDL